MIVYLETSALLKVYHDEKGSDNLAAYLRRRDTDFALIVSDLSFVEFHSAIMRKARLSEISFVAAREILDRFKREIERYSVLSVDDTVLSTAIVLLETLGTKIHLRSLDAIQLASALIVRRSEIVESFVTSDTRLVDAARHFFRVFNPEVKTTS